MLGQDGSRWQQVFPVLGIAYLLYLTTLEPPVRWLGIACLAILTPFVVGWLLGRFAGVGPWAKE